MFGVRCWFDSGYTVMRRFTGLLPNLTPCFSHPAVTFSVSAARGAQKFGFSGVRLHGHVFRIQCSAWSICVLMRQSTDLEDFQVFLREGGPRILRSRSHPAIWTLFPPTPCIWLSCVSSRRLSEEFHHFRREGVPRFLWLTSGWCLR